MEKQLTLGDVSIQGGLKKNGDSPQDTGSSSMTTIKGVRRILWRPNNWRRYLEIMPKSGLYNSCPKTPEEMNRILGMLPVEVTHSSHTKLIFIKLGHNMTVQVGKKSLVGIWSQSIVGGHKETYLIEAGDDQALDARLDVKKAEIRGKIDSALFMVARKLKVMRPLTDPIWLRHEDWIKGDDFIDNIPSEVIIHDTVFKKVYGEGVEFIGGKGKEPTVGIKNYIKNRALESFLPGIQEEFVLLRESNLAFAENLKTHLKVLKDIGRGVGKLNRVVDRLGQRKVDDFV